MIEHGKVVCPWHAWAFDPVTGETEESKQKVAVYPVSVSDEEVFVGV
jgi:nitrite reductase (NADH) small subunit